MFDHSTLAQRVIFATGGAIRNISRGLEVVDSESVLVITGRSNPELARQVAESVPAVALIDQVVQHVPADRVRTATALARQSGADSIVAVGGGSAIGLAKAVALEIGLPIVAVPTTFSGSEATAAWGITEGRRKRTGVSERALPRVVIYDPELMPFEQPGFAAASGLNALAHAVDALWGPAADPINAIFAIEAVRTLVETLRKLRESGLTLDVSEQLTFGAYLAASAFSSAGSGMHHKICHVLGGAYALPHAEMHAVVLPYVVRVNESAVPAVADRIAAITGGRSASQDLQELSRSVSSSSSLAELGLREGDIAEAARRCLELIPKSNPTPMTLGDVERLLRAAWNGESIH